MATQIYSLKIELIQHNTHFHKIKFMQLPQPKNNKSNLIESQKLFSNSGILTNSGFLTNIGILIKSQITIATVKHNYPWTATLKSY